MREGEGGFDAVLPVGGGGFVLFAELAHVVVGGGVEGCAGVGDFNGGAVRGNWGDLNVDGHREFVGDDGDVLHAAGVDVEDGVDPDGGERAVLGGEDGTFDVAGGLRVGENRIPVVAGPAALGFGREEWGDLFHWGGDFEGEGVEHVSVLRRGRCGLRWLLHRERDGACE